MKKNNEDEIKKYFEKTQSSYNIIWMNRKNLAMHYGFWDKSTKKLHDALINENKIVADELNIMKTDLVLDAGCGVGGTSIWVAETYSSKVTGISIVEKQIKQARKHARNRKVGDLVNFELMDYCKTDFEDESFDKIYAIESMCYAEDKQEFLKEMFRLLKPGGALAVADAFLSDEIMNAKDNERFNNWLGGWAVPNLPKLSQFLNDLKVIGFVDEKHRNVKDMIIPSVVRIYKIGRLFYPFDNICNKLKLLSDETFRSTVASLSQYELFSNDLMQYHLIIISKPKR